VDQNTIEAAHNLPGDAKVMDVWLKGLWDRAKKAAELISRLREEKLELQAKVASLEQELDLSRQELAKNEEVIGSLSVDRGKTDHLSLLNGERELLSAKVRELLAKLDGYI
jgi:hypothetical protein